MQITRVSPEQLHRFLLLSGSAFMVGSGKDMRISRNAMALMLFNRAFAELGEDWHERTDCASHQNYQECISDCRHASNCDNFRAGLCRGEYCRAYQPSTQQKPPHAMESYEQDSINRTLNREMDIESGRWESGSACRITLAHVADWVPTWSEGDWLRLQGMGVARG